MNILVAIDNSPTAQAALAAVLARNWPDASSIRLLTVIPSKGYSADTLRKQLSEAHELLDRYTQEIESKNTDSIVAGQIDRGELSNAILKVAHSWPADLIIVGADDKTGLDRIFHKSTSEHVFEHASCSLLVARNIHGKKEFSDILIAVEEDSINSNILVDTVLSASWPDNSRFHILTVAKPNLSAGSFEPNGFAVIRAVEEHQARLSSLHASIEKLRRQLECRYSSFSFEKSVMEGHPETAILEFAKDKDIDLVLVGSGGKSQFRRKILGSVSQAVARKAHCSVQVVRSSVTPLFKSVPERTTARKLDLVSGF